MNKLARYLFISLSTSIFLFSIVLPLNFVDDIVLAADPPVANNDTYSTPKNITLNVPPPGVLGNDTGDNLTASLQGYAGPGTVNLNSDGSFTYTPNAGYVGSDSFAYTAIQADNQTSTATVSITVTNTPPVANDQTVTTDKDTAITITLTATDADGDPLDYYIETPPANGSLSGAPPSVTYTPNPDYSGSDSFTFKANDGTNDSNIATVSITVTNTPPVANDQTVTTDIDTAITITLTATDADGDPLTYYIETPPANGSLSGAPPSVTYTPDPDYSGSDSFTFKTNDGTDNSNIATVTITVTNTSPVANDQTVTTDKDTAITITLTATDADGDPLTYSIVTPPANGSLSGAPPSVTYTPDPDYSGSDSFTFKAHDGTIDSNIATVTITVTNTPPVANKDTYITTKGTALSVPLLGVLANDIDDDGDVLTAIKVTDPASGTVTLNSNGSFTYTPNIGFVGADSFSYKANDGDVDSNTATVTIIVNAENTSPGVNNISTLIDDSGLFNKDFTALSDDTKVQLKINAGTIGKTTDGKPFTEIIIKKTTNIKNPPKDVNIIGAVYEFGPSGVIFNLKVIINIIYNPEDILEGVSETNLVIGYYDEKAQAWITLDSVVDTVAHSIKTQTDRFSLYGVLSGPITVQTIPANAQTPPINTTDLEVKAAPVEAAPQKTAWLYIIIGIVAFLISFSITVFVARRYRARGNVTGA